MDAQKIGTDALRAKVGEAPWSFFHLPVECWTTELALIAWRHVGFVLARVPSDFSPSSYFDDGKWEQFVELLCGNPIVAILATSGATQNWRSVVSCINDYLVHKNTNEREVQLPYLADR